MLAFYFTEMEAKVMANEHPAFLLVGGQSGAGKTSLINALIAQFPQVYERPISYTTRHRRTDEASDEYIFICRDEMLSLFEKGLLLNLDYNYGNYYGMSKESVFNIFKEFKCAIKEIHPQYHSKIKQLVPNSLSILIRDIDDTPQDRFHDEKHSRRREDDAFYSTIDENCFDIVLYYDKTLTPKQNAIIFHKRIQGILCTASNFPLSGVIDQQNRDGYMKIADHFTDQERITTRNFHDISYGFFENVFRNVLLSQARVLELGPGRGWLRNTFHWNPPHYICVDIAANMISENRPPSIVSSVRAIPIHSESVDYIISSLADPFFYPEALSEISRILNTGGLFIFSMPAYEWAKNIREPERLHKTVFVLPSGEEAEVFSFALPEVQIVAMLRNYGLHEVSLSTLTGRLLTTGEIISPAIAEAAERAGKSINDLEIVTVGIFRKEDE